MLMPGCSFNLFGNGTKDVYNVPKDVKRDIGELNDDPIPRKNFDHKEAEKSCLALAKKKVISANDKSSEYIVKEDLRTANDLLEAIARSLGNPAIKVDSDPLSIVAYIESLDRENKKFRLSQAKFEENMEENRMLISRLQGIIKAKTEVEKSLWSKVTFWFWAAIILSVLVAVFVPGGMVIVNRFWSKSAEVFIKGAKSAGKAASEMSHALSEYMKTLDMKEQEVLKNHLNRMRNGACDFWEEVKQGNNPLINDIHNLPDKIKKKV